MQFKKILLSATILSSFAFADTYSIDDKGRHAFINFKVSHLGYSFVLGTFKEISGTYDYDSATGEISNVNVTVETKSLDSTHAERDKHLRGADFLDVATYPTATFTSSSYQDGQLTGDLTIRGITKTVTLPIQKIGEGEDPWGNERSGFQTSITLALKDFGIEKDLGPQSQNFELNINFEGIKQ